MTSSKRQLRASAAFVSSALLVLSLGLSALSAYWFTLPNLLGFSGQDLLSQRDFWCLLGAVGCALAAGVIAFRYALASVRPARGSLVFGLVFGTGLAFLLLLWWWQSLLYYALLIAPAQAFALLGVGLSVRRKRRDAAFERFGFGSSPP
jgi:hypothetical protein